MGFLVQLIQQNKKFLIVWDIAHGLTVVNKASITTFIYNYLSWHPP